MANKRISEMVKSWNLHKRAFSTISKNDTAFFAAIGLSCMEVGTTSQCGNDVIYYDTKVFNSGADAIKNRPNYMNK